MTDRRSAVRRTNPNRRALLKSSSALAAGVTMAPLFAGLTARHAEAAGPARGFGPIAPVADQTTGLPLLKLPAGFSYRTFGWTGDVMSDGTLTPDRHDGMAVVSVDWRARTLTMIRNHERGASAPDNPLAVIGAGAAPVYDEFALPGVVSGLGGGTTALTYQFGRGSKGLVADSGTLGGTLTNCAGGPTPWGSWLTCEEGIVSDPNDTFGQAFGVSVKEHGYVYEVPAPELGVASGAPIIGMGKMDHEAAAVDPRSGAVYLTEDNGPNSGFFRFLPDNTSRSFGALEDGGTLQMMRVIGDDNADLRTPTQGDVFEVDWVDVADPNLDPELLVPPDEGFPPIAGAGRSGPYLQGEALGGARFQRGEGCWEFRGVIYWIDTSGGAAGKGVVWALIPGRGRPDRLLALFVSPNQEVADNPDNITLSRRGGIVVCEDGGGFTGPDGTVVGTRMIGMDRRGESFVFAENNMVLEDPLPGRPFIPTGEDGDYRSSEFAGACFDPLGRILFGNIQTPGVTFAIEGPWWRGGL